MAQRVTLDLFLNDRGALTSIEDLRAGIELAQKELEGLDRASSQFATLKSAISSANSELADQRKQLKGITSEEFTSAFARIGAGIGSAFAAGTAALNLFGVESERVTQAAAEAQNVLTIAISSRQILEGILSLRLLANNAAEKIRLVLLKANIIATNEQTASEVGNTVAQEANTGSKVKNTVAVGTNTGAVQAETGAKVANTAATTAGTTATGLFTGAIRILYGVMAANPFVALLTLVGGLVAGYLLLRDSTDEAAEAQRNYNKAVQEGIAGTLGQRFEVQGLVKVIKDANATEADRLAAYKLLQKILPSLGDLTLEQAQATGELNKAIQRNVDIQEKRAELEVAVGDASEKYAAAQILVTEIEDKLAKGQEVTNEQLAKRDKAIKDNTVSQERAAAIQEELTALLIDENQSLTANTNEKGRNSAATQSQINNNNRLIAILDELGRYLKDEIKLYKEFGKVVAVEDKLPSIVERANKAFKVRIDLINDTTNAFFKGLKDLGLVSERTSEDFFLKTNRIFEKAGEGIVDNLVNITDVYGNTINQSYDKLVNAIGRTTGAFEDNLNQVKETFLTLFETGQITPDALKSLNALSSNLTSLNGLITQGTVSLNDLFNERNVQSYLSATRQILAVQGEITTEYDELLRISKDITIDRQNYRKNEQTIADFEEGVRQRTITGLKEFLRLGEEGFRERVEQARQTEQITQKQYEALIGLIEKGGKREIEFQRLIGEIAEQRVESIRNQVQATEKEFDRIRRYNLQFEQNRLRATRITGAAIVGLIEDETDEFIRLYQFRVDKQLSFAKKAEAGQAILNAAGLRNIKFTEEEKVKVYEATFQYQQELKRKEREEDVKSIQRFIQIIQQALSEYQGALQTAQETALERLELNYNRQLERITENTRENYRERIRLEEEYQAQVAEIQKKYRIRQLRLDQAQAIANGALAITRAYAEGGIAGLVTGTIVGLATAAQVVTLNQQIALAQSYKSGGMIKAQEGLIVRGPSHENGGVNFQNGAYNLEGGESVVNRVSSRNFQGLLSQINQMGGGRPLVASFDDSRIVDALAKQRMEPIRAYVVEQDITNQQAVSKRLEQLSKF